MPLHLHALWHGASSQPELLLLAVVWYAAVIQQMAAFKRWSLLEARAATKTQQIRFG